MGASLENDRYLSNNRYLSRSLLKRSPSASKPPLSLETTAFETISLDTASLVPSCFLSLLQIPLSKRKDLFPHRFLVLLLCFSLSKRPLETLSKLSPLKALSTFSSRRSPNFHFFTSFCLNNVCVACIRVFVSPLLFIDFIAAPFPPYGTIPQYSGLLH